MLFTLALWHITEWIPEILNNFQIIYNIIKEFQF